MCTQVPGNKLHGLDLVLTLAQARNMSIGRSRLIGSWHRRTSALLRNIRNIRICLGKKPIVSVTHENERISIKNSLPYLKCVSRLSCVIHGPIYGRFIYGFLCQRFSLHIKVYKGLPRLGTPAKRPD